jgi:hypothetical protein
MIGQIKHAIRVQPEGFRAGWDQPGSRDRIAAGEQRDLMSLLDQFLGEIRNDSLSTAVELRGDTLIQWGDLCNLQLVFSSTTATFVEPKNPNVARVIIEYLV